MAWNNLHEFLVGLLVCTSLSTTRGFYKLVYGHVLGCLASGPLPGCIANFHFYEFWRPAVNSEIVVKNLRVLVLNYIIVKASIWYSK